ncbi:MAG: serine hydrolase [Parvularcula sp.]|jgi:CubicO group peptidase (beta-lactamase class C family)|nr:serine hydrolase [Parvularcula sp.]
MIQVLSVSLAAAALLGTFPEVESDERVERFRGLLAVSDAGNIEAYVSGEEGGESGLRTAYPFASITKAFTAVLIMSLVEEGSLTLGSTVGSVLNAYADDPIGDVTVEQLLTHTGGIPDPAPGEEGSGVGSLAEMARGVDGPGDIIANFAAMDLMFEAGSRYDYSNSGFILLGAMAEAVTGLPYEEALRERVLKPAGVEDQFCLCVDLEGYPDVHGREWLAGEETNAVQVHPSRSYAAGGLRGTAEGLVRWTEALVAGRILSKKALDALWAPRVDTRREGVQYGYGWIITEMDGRRVVGHDGALPGIVSSLWVMPEQQRTALGVLTRTLPLEHLSRSETYVGRLTEDTLLGQDRDIVPALARPSRSLEGTFTLPDGKSFVIDRNGGELTLSTDPGWSVFQIEKLGTATGPGAELAERAATAWSEGGQAAMESMFSEDLRANLPPGALDGAWSGFEVEFGPLSSSRVYAVSEDDGFAEVRFSFERAAVDVGFVLSPDGSIEGVQMIGVETETPPTSAEVFPTADGRLFIDGYRYGLDDILAGTERGFFGIKTIGFGKGDSLQARKK